MTQDKELLLKDLCARLPYGVKAKYYGSAEECECCDTIEGIYLIDDEVVIGQYGLSVENVKPYLFPPSSMTEEQKDDMIKSSCGIGLDKNVFDWYNKNHFDYRNLINKNLAIDCTNLNIY